MYTNKNDKDQVKNYKRGKDEEVVFDVDATVQVKGNIKIDFRSFGGLGSDKEVFRITFNTAFIGESNRLFLTRTEISPENNHKDLK